MCTWGLPGGVAERARDAALKAVEIDPDSAVAHAALAEFRLFLEWDWPAAEQAVLRALELSPSSDAGWAVYGLWLTVMGRLEEAVEARRSYQELSPLSGWAASWLGIMLWRTGARDEALAEFEKAIDLAPGNVFAQEYRGAALCASGMVQEGIEALERAKEATGDDPAMISTQAWCHAISGQRDEARRLLRELEERAETSPVSPVLFAGICAGLGEVDRAFEWLERAYAAPVPILPLTLRQSWTLDPLRSDPRFDDLLRRMGLPES